MTLCRQNGIDVKNQLSTIEPEVRDQVVQLVQKRGSGAATGPGSHRPLPPVDRRIPVLEANKPRPAPELGRTSPKPPAPPAPPAPAETAAKPAIPPTHSPLTGTPVPS